MPIDANRRREVQRLVPDGALVSRSWLLDHELTNHAIDNLLKSKQLVSVKNGVYKREGTRVEWGDVIYFIQRIMGLDLTIGGISALELQKMGHYLSLSNKRTIHLYGKDVLPGWLGRATDDAGFVKHTMGNAVTSREVDISSEGLVQFTKSYSWKSTQEGLRMSTPELAILEVLHEVPSGISFEHADELMQGLSTLSPKSLQKLLVLCDNIKVRRLFFWFAERQNHVWLKKIDKDLIDLGSGNRVIAKGGKLNKTYQITVPEMYE